MLNFLKLLLHTVLATQIWRKKLELDRHKNGLTEKGQAHHFRGVYEYGLFNRIKMKDQEGWFIPLVYEWGKHKGGRKPEAKEQCWHKNKEIQGR